MPISKRSVPQGINEKSTRQRFAYSSLRKPEEFTWRVTDRWGWAYGLPVSAKARAVAGCIANHANTKNGRCFPGMGTIVKETGFSRSSVIRAIKELECGGYITVRRFKVGKKNKTNNYQLPPIGSVTSSDPSVTVTLGGSVTVTPELRSTELRTKQQQRIICENEQCTNSWPSHDKDGRSYGTTCHSCNSSPSTPDNEQSPTAADHARPPNCMCGSEHEDPSRWCVYCGGLRSNSQREWRVSQCQQ